MVNKSKVSVVMITYGHENYIEQAINGVLMQKCNFDIQLIIANDCSPDQTDDKILQVLEKNPNSSWVKYIKHKKNIGMIPNFVYALKEANGEYIAICEGDDYWVDPYKLQKQVDFLESKPTFGLVFTDADLFYQKTQELIKSYDKTFKRKIPTGHVLKILIEGNPYKTCTSLFRNELIKDIFELNKLNGKAYGDKSIWMHIAAKSNVGYIPESTSVYRVLESSASHFNNVSEAITFYKEAYIDSIEKSEFYKIPIDKNKLKRDFNKTIINFCLEHNKYRALVSYYKNLDLIFYLLLKENLVRPLFKKLNKN